MATTPTAPCHRHLALQGRLPPDRRRRSPVVQSAAFSEPAPGQISNQRRNQYSNPGFSDVDFSIVKNTKIAGNVTFQLRAEMFNLFNRINLAPVGAPQTSAGGNSIGSTIGAFFGAPGIGPGEPFNLQFAGKIIF